MNGQATFHHGCIFSILIQLHFIHIGDFPFKGRFGIFTTLHIILVEMLLHQSLFKLESLDQDGKFHVACLGVHHGGGFAVVSFDLFHRGIREERNFTFPGEIFLSI